MEIVKDLLYENNELSLTRAIALFGYLLFGIASVYMIAMGVTWPDYSTFAAYTGGAGAALQLGNKAINSKWNSAVGSYKPIESKKIIDAAASTVVNAVAAAPAQVKEDKDPDVVIPRSNVDKK